MRGNMAEEVLNTRLKTRERLMAYGEIFPELTQKLTKQEYKYYIWYTEGLTLKEVGEKYGVTPERVKQVLSRVERKFRAKARDAIETCRQLKELADLL